MAKNKKIICFDRNGFRSDHGEQDNDESFKRGSRDKLTKKEALERQKDWLENEDAQKNLHENLKAYKNNITILDHGDFNETTDPKRINEIDDLSFMEKLSNFFNK